MSRAQELGYGCKNSHSRARNEVETRSTRDRTNHVHLALLPPCTEEMQQSKDYRRRRRHPRQCRRCHWLTTTRIARNQVLDYVHVPALGCGDQSGRAVHWAAAITAAPLSSAAFSSLERRLLPYRPSTLFNPGGAASVGDVSGYFYEIPSFLITTLTLIYLSCELIRLHMKLLSGRARYRATGLWPGRRVVRHQVTVRTRGWNPVSGGPEPSLTELNPSHSCLDLLELLSHDKFCPPTSSSSV